MPAMPREFTITRPDVVVPVRVDPTGRNGPTKGQARGRHWRQTSQGFHVPSSVDVTIPEQRIVEAAVALPKNGGVTGWAALRWEGGTWFDGMARGGKTPRPVTLAVGPHDIRPQADFEVSQEHLNLRELTVLDGLSMTTAVRSLCFEMRYAANLREAVKSFCMAAYSDLVSSDEMSAYLAIHTGWDGIPLAREAMPLVEENCWSPPEVDMFLTWTVQAQFGRPLCNHPVFDRRGRHIGTPDLIDPESGVVGQYNGEIHLDGGQRRDDRESEEAYRRVGLEVFTLLRGDFGERGRALDLMLQTRKRARFEAESTRAWTVDLPAWWIPTFTVEQRRNLTPAQRERMLRYRRTPAA